MAATINLPHRWKYRDYQKAAWQHFAKGGRFAALAWHRRAGKDDLALNLLACKAHERVGTYWHMLPEYAQGRKAIWNAVNPHSGKRRIDEAFPAELRKRTNDQEMFIEFRNGSTWQVVGSDSYNRNVGSPPVGVVASEWALANPAAWAYIRPIITENQGLALFISTYRGRNHHYDLVKRAMASPDWFGQELSVVDTGVLSPQQIEHERQEYLAEYGTDEGDALFRQEWLCDPMAAIQGAFYGAEMATAEREGRVCPVPVERGVPVSTWWDLGFDDETAIWFVQMVGRELRVVDYYAARNQPLAHYARVLREKADERRIEFGEHLLPHDGGHKQITTGKTIKQQLEESGLSRIRVVPRAKNEQAVLAGINAGRKLIERAVFDDERTQRGREALLNYRREWDESLKTYKPRPLHDWASHGADAWRTGAVGMKPARAEEPDSWSTSAPVVMTGPTSWMGA